MPEQMPHAGARPLFLIIIVVVVVGSWIIYRYFAPKSWRGDHPVY